MSITKIAIIVGASVVTAGSSAAIATRSKWWPSTTETEEETDELGQKDTAHSEVRSDGARQGEHK